MLTFFHAADLHFRHMPPLRCHAHMRYAADVTCCYAAASYAAISIRRRRAQHVCC